MNAAQSAALVFSQSVAALAEVAGMWTENTQRGIGKPPVYMGDDFFRVIARRRITHDAVMRIFEEAGP
jgi:hypothetical protein